MPRFRRSRKAFRRGKRNFIWTALEFPFTTVTTAANITGDIVLPSDWTNIAGFQKGAVLRRIRGSVCFLIADGANATAPLYELISVNRVGEAFGLITVNTLVQEDILWHRWSAVARAGAWAAGAPTQSRMYYPSPAEIDVKANRRLDTNTNISYTVRIGLANPEPQIAGAFRALIEIPS